MRVPLVSFIIPYHNESAEMLDMCIRSIRSLALTDNEREIIVVDDGSETDLLKGAGQHSTVVTYIRQENQGVSVARNTGLEAACGEYVQLVDADDWLVKAHYDHCLYLLRSQKPDVVAFSFTHDGKERHDAEDFTMESGADYMSQHNMYGSACCYLFKRQLTDGLRFKEGKRYSEDEEFTALLMVQAHKTCVTTSPAYYYRKHNASATHQNDPKNLETRLREQLDTLLSLRKALPTLPCQQKAGLERRVAQLAMDYLYNTIRWKRSSKDLEIAVNKLTSNGLYPLVSKEYTTKYKWFRRLMETSLGRHLLLVVIPILSH